MCNKKSQIWTLDLISGVIIFFIIVITYFIFVNNISDTNQNNLDALYQDAIIISDTLMSEGLPPDWNPGTVLQIGITNNNYRLNSTKVTFIPGIEYDRLKILVGSKYDFLVFFEDKNGNMIDIMGIPFFGKIGVDPFNIKQIENPDSLVAIKRFIIYDKKIITMVVYVWE